MTTRRTYYSAAGLIARQITFRLGGTIAVAVLVALCVGGLAVLPQKLAVLADEELRYSIAALSPVRVDVTATAILGAQRTDAATATGIFGATDDALRAIPHSIASPLGDLMGEPQWIAQLSAAPVGTPAPLPGVAPELRLTVDLAAADHLRYVDGAAPSAWLGDATAPLEIALSRAGAAAFGLAVGDQLDSPYGTLRVSGITEAVDASSVFWAHADPLVQPLVIKSPGSPDRVIVSAFVNPLSARGLSGDLAEADLTVWYPTAQPQLRYAESGELLQQIARLSTIGDTLPNGQRLTFRTGMPDALEGVTVRVSTLRALLGLAGSAPLGVVIAALVLAIRTVVAARQPSLDLGIARGASTLDVRRVMAVEGAAVAGVAAVVGLAVATASTGILGVEALTAPLVLAAAVPVIFALSLRSSRGRPQRVDARSRGRSRARWLVEVAVVGLAAVAFLLLARRGLSSSATVGFDPLLALTPLLLSLAVCVVVLRVYPLPLLAIQRAARGRRGVVALLGSARAIRQPAIGFVSVVAMLVGVSTAVFSLVLSATMSAGLETGARASVGADYRIDSAVISDAALSDLGQVDGVDAIAALEYVSRVDVRSAERVSVTVIIADTAALHAVRPDLPALDEGGARVLASAGLADRLGTTLRIEEQEVALDGYAASDALPRVDGDWLLLDSAYADETFGTSFEPTSVLVTGAGADPEALLAALPGGTIVDTAAVLAESAERPSVSGLRVALGIASALAAVMAALTVALGAVASAPARNRLVAVAHILGMSPRQARGVVAWDVAPVALVSIVAGVGLGVILPSLVLGVVDLRELIGGVSAVRIAVPWALIAVGVAGFCAVVATAGITAVAVARRVDPARQLRIGAE